MCRMLGYLGDPVLLDDLVIQPDNSLMHQVTNPQMLSEPNLAGFGIAGWDDAMADPHLPLCFRSTNVAILDPNLRALARKLRVRGLVAHVRGVSHDGRADINQQNLHPFQFPGSPIVFAHNGDLAEFDQMRFALLEHLTPEAKNAIRGSNDSAWLHGLFVSQLENPAAPASADELYRAVSKTLTIVRKVREQEGIRTSSAVNLIISDGRNMLATRFTFDFGCFEEPPYQGGINYLSKWFTLGDRYEFRDGEWKMIGDEGRSTLIASEPLTRDISTWVEVPEYAALLIDSSQGCQRRRVLPLDV